MRFFKPVVNYDACPSAHGYVVRVSEDHRRPVYIGSDGLIVREANNATPFENAKVARARAAEHKEADPRCR